VGKRVSVTVPTRRAMPKEAAAKKQDLEGPLIARARAFSDLYEQATSSPAVLSVIVEKLGEAMLAWAVMKMGLKRPQYLAEGMRDFAVLCALRALSSAKKIEEVVKEVNFELPVKLTGKRTGFTALLPRLYTIAAEYEKVCEIARSAKINVRSEAQFRFNLRGKLECFAEEEKLQPPLTRKQIDALIKDYHLKIKPSEIAEAYVGKRLGTSPANVKKLIGLVRDPARVNDAIFRYLKKQYLPPDFEALRRELTQGAPQPSR
jgi:hypothetical protein